MNARNIFTELKRRNVYKVAVAYAVVGWLLIQVATQVLPFLEIPNWAIRFVIFITALGFPIALVIAWAFELTPEGIKRTEDADAARQHSRGGVWIAVVVVAATLSLGLFFLGRYSAGRATPQVSETPIASNPQKSIAVLPLVNTSGDPSNEYFSDGLSEELIAVLAKIPELKVIGRSSSFFFKGKSGDSAAIGQKLGVANLIEGSVRKQGDRVRIVAELISAVDGRSLWSETYDRELKDVFAVQAEIAKSVAEQMKVKLLGERQQSDAAPSNQNLAAHNAVLQADFYFQQLTPESVRRAISIPRGSGAAGSKLCACLRQSYHRLGANTQPALPQTMRLKRTRRPAELRRGQLTWLRTWLRCGWRWASWPSHPIWTFVLRKKNSGMFWNTRPITPLPKRISAPSSRRKVDWPKQSKLAGKLWR